MLSLLSFTAMADKVEALHNHANKTTTPETSAGHNFPQWLLRTTRGARLPGSPLKAK